MSDMDEVLLPSICDRLEEIAKAQARIAAAAEDQARALWAQAFLMSLGAPEQLAPAAATWLTRVAAMATERLRVAPPDRPAAGDADGGMA